MRRFPGAPRAPGPAKPGSEGRRERIPELGIIPAFPGPSWDWAKAKKGEKIALLGKKRLFLAKKITFLAPGLGASIPERIPAGIPGFWGTGRIFWERSQLPRAGNGKGATPEPGGNLGGLIILGGNAMELGFPGGNLPLEYWESTGGKKKRRRGRENKEGTLGEENHGFGAKLT